MHGSPPGNNGGSSTIIKSANTLVDLGHEVTVIANAPNLHEWTPLKAKYNICPDTNKVPAADAIIATGFLTAAHTARLPNKCGKKLHWIRAWETWQMGEETDIIQRVLEMPTRKLVNGGQLMKKLQTLNCPSTILRPGYDYEDLYFTDDRKINPNIIIGGLYRTGYHGTRKRTDWIFKTVQALRKKGHKISLWMFGTDFVKNGCKIDKYFLKPDAKTKNFFYNKVDIWLAPTQSEGLHMPAAEAMLTECPVVGTNAPLSGMEDYLKHELTGLVADNNIESFIKNVERLMKDRILRENLGLNGSLKIRQLGNREKNMKWLVEILEG